MTLCTNVLLFCMCYAVYDGIGETCWCWDATPESNSWVMKSADVQTLNIEALELCSKQWSLHQRCLLIWRLVYVTFGCVTLPPRFRLGIVFGGEVWRSRDATSFAANLCSTSLAAKLFTYLLWFIYRFSFAFWSSLVVDRRRFIWNFPVACVCLAVLARNCFKCFSRFL